LVVIAVPVVVFAQSQATALVWLNVVVKFALERLRFPAAFPIAFQITVPEGMSAATIAR
jgi:hypothetical protein